MQHIKEGCLLDVGTGPARLLYEINKKNPDIEHIVLGGLPIYVRLELNKSQ